MPIEIKELVIRAFVGNENPSDYEPESPKEKKASNEQDVVSIVVNMLQQQDER